MNSKQSTATRKSRRTARLLVQKGQDSYKAGRLGHAKELFRKACAVDPTFADALFSLAVVFIDENRLREAEGALRTGLARREAGFAYTLLGAVQRRRGLLSEARQNYERSLALDSSDDEAHMGLALVIAVAEPKEALRHMRLAAKLDPSYEGLHREMGKVLWRLGRMRAAERALRRAVRLYADDPWAHSYLGSILGHAGNWNGALRHFAAAAELVPRWPLFWADVGMAFAQLGNAVDADAAFRRALSLDMNDVTANLRYGQFLMRGGRRSTAARYLKRALRKDPTNLRAQKALASLASAKGR